MAKRLRKFLVGILAILMIFANVVAVSAEAEESSDEEISDSEEYVEEEPTVVTEEAPPEAVNSPAAETEESTEEVAPSDPAEAEGEEVEEVEEVERGGEVPIPGDMLGGVGMLMSGTISRGGVDIFSGDVVSIEGRVDTQPIKDKMTQYEPMGRGTDISEVHSQFTVNLTVPEEFTLPSNIQKADVHFTENELFDVEILNQTEHSLYLRMTLKKDDGYTRFDDLYRDVQNAPRYLSVTVAGVKVGNVTDGTIYKAVGMLHGNFTAQSRFPMNFEFPVSQDDSAANLPDVNRAEGEDIVFSFVGRTPDQYKGDLSVRDGEKLDTVHEKVFEGEKGKEYSINFEYDLTSYKRKLTEAFQGEGNLVQKEHKLNIMIKLPNGLSLKDGYSLTSVNAPSLSFEEVNVPENADYSKAFAAELANVSTYEELRNAINNLPDKLVLELNKLEFSSDAEEGVNYTISSDGGFSFRAVRGTEDNAEGIVNERAVYIQNMDGKDVLAGEDTVNMTLSMTLASMDTDDAEEPEMAMPNHENSMNKDDMKPEMKPERRTPNTGDETNMAIFVILGSISLLGGGVVMSLKKRQK